MANRFLESNYYKSPFVRSLKGALKSLYSFIICDCTAAGIWAMDMEAASLYIGFTVNMDEFKENFVDKGKAVLIGSGKYFFPDFIEHQYPSGLQSWNKSHNKIIFELNKLGFLREEIVTKEIKGKKENLILFFVNKGPSKGLQSSQGNGHGNGIGNGQGNGNGIAGESLIGKMLSEFKKQIPTYAADPDRDGKPLGEIANFINNQCKGVGDVSKNINMILKEWQAICLVIKKDKFYNTKPLKTISSQIQEIFQITKNAGSETKNHGAEIDEFDNP